SDDLSEGSDIDGGYSDNEAENDMNLADANLVQVRPGDDENLQGFFASDSDSDSEFEGFHGDIWAQDARHFTPRLPRRFSGNPGAAEQHPEEAQPYHYFSMLWGDEMWQHLVTETNRYAEQERLRNPPPPNAAKWVPVDVPTLKAFIGLVFSMGIIKLPHRYDYWRQKRVMFRTAFNNIMPRNKFSQIWRYLHLHDSQAPPPDQPDKLLKIRWFIDYLNDKCSKAYAPYGHYTVDESMIKFKGRLSFRQYLPAKPVKWGVKMWSLCESTTGYLHRFQIYTGKEGMQEKGLSHRVVMDLIGHLEQQNIPLFMDNFYTGTKLLTELIVHGIYACGTVRANRKSLPTALLPKNARLQKHEYKVAQKDDLTFCIWMDTKSVLVLSNFHSPDSVGSVNRRSGQALQQRVRVPKMVEDYQAHMKGVDLMDQMIGYYMIQHRSKKWWRRIFHYLLMACAHNAYIIASDSNPDVVKSEWPNFQDFIEELAEGLIGNYSSSKREVPNQNVARAGVVHEVKNLYGENR
ncbi:MAG: transposase, partial [Candidatus Thiodiazotropha sp.]